ncbi:MAG TPA: ThuA domain-containing protein [Chitinophaga sp.]|uniref:ThuA domain-containing protein n=1 Tax=Chitinophaga sp. TaxID=1869181 RepID=UPI002BC2856E|nr:ThuA domain-containing protein [Chitinophaga sp.]HVI49088.1 ThuA domain-containing protein [Chitinophaga sp.]
MKYLLLLLLCYNGFSGTYAQHDTTRFHVIAFYTAREDAAHISFVHESNKWFAAQAAAHHFSYDATNDWNKLNTDTLSHYQVVIFLDSRPDSLPQRLAFQHYMENGGAWMGFHFAAFALTPSAFPQNWNWYHQQFLGAGSYDGNTWRPVSAVLRTEHRQHPVVKTLPDTFVSAPNEWYKWTNDLRKNPDIIILVSIDPSSFPLGTGPKPHEIWHNGYYPVAWTNKKYRMVYINMGHNDMDYEHHTNATLSSTFASETQNRLIINSLLWLGRRK